MTASFEFGNVATSWTHRDDGTPTYWFAGHFIKEDSLRRTELFGCKWGVHQPAEGEQFKTAEKGLLTMSVLIKGSMKYWMRVTGTENWTEKILDQQGDFIIWNEGIDHKYLALEDDTTFMTVRCEKPPE